jgi:Lon protease-like protein
MPGRLIPLFPLRVVVFPRTPLPLHIFEERYKEMVGNALRDRSEFGVVLAKEEGIVNAGCTVTVEKLFHLYPDGRMDVLTRGVRRFEVISLNQEKDYLQAEVSFFDDEDTPDAAPEELRAQAVLHYRDLQGLETSSERSEADLADPQLSFQLAQSLPDLDFLSTLLRHRSETERLHQLNHYLSNYIPRKRAIEHMKAVAPTNGFGPKPAGT